MERVVNKLKGFTLIELLVTIVILSIILTIMLPKLAITQFQALVTGCCTNEKSLATSIEVYRTNSITKRYPTSLDELLAADYLPFEILCPSNDSAYTFEVGDDIQGFSLYCNGIHYMQLSGYEEHYPRYISTAGLQMKPE